jgi:hypothetical protein
MVKDAGKGDLREVAAAQAPLRREPSPDAALDTEALKGQHVTIDQTTAEGWTRVKLADDGYVGWLPTATLRAAGAAATHKVAALRTLVFPGPSIKLPPIEAISLGCRFAVTRITDPFAVTVDGGFVPACHLVPVDACESDWVAVAEKFVGVPYLWGGKTSFGLDCSGLVQVALTAAGILCPRDSIVQERALGTALSNADRSSLRRGDLLFWKGHVAIARDALTLLHANAFHMAVATEPIYDAIARIRAAGSELTNIKRL